MESTRSFLRLWIVITFAILTYAALDLWLHPSLHQEMHFTMQPDVSQIGDLWHWGGRLLKEGAITLLVANAIVMGGLLALVGRSIARLVARLRGVDDDADDAHTTFADVHGSAIGTHSVPPPPSAA
jgi:hypothetical protein